MVFPQSFVIESGECELLPHSRGVILRKRERASYKTLLMAPQIVLTGNFGRPLAIGADPLKVRHYRGDVRVRRSTDRLHPGLECINHVDAFNYVVSVVGSESTPEFKREALKAQAVLVFTRLQTRDRRKPLDDTTQEMAYLGSDYVRPEVLDAVRQIHGQKLLYAGRPARVFFHASCAGRTSTGEAVFGKPAAALKYLVSVPCDYCKGSPLYKQTVTQIPLERFTREIAIDIPKVLKSDRANRPELVELNKSGRNETLSGYQLWMQIGQKFGWDKAPGLRYALARAGNNVMVKSSGGGHGVGLCQWGAQGLAEHGKTYDEILKFYFPGCHLEAR
ncbi:MAG: SpoIID/LytB domain-containing protein, partial [Leptolyngbya sp.]|nr:SpoIID/LytB domain-containing protein [Candidatus Melainabacteria bacterium]